VTLGDGVESLRKLRQQLGTNWNNWTTVVESLLYDFHDEHSSDLGKLSNPLRPEQNQKFCQLVGDFFNPRLAPYGLVVTTANLSVS